MSVSAVTWFIRYIYCWNLKFLYDAIIIKTKVLLLQTILAIPVRPFGFLVPKDYWSISFPIFRLWGTWWRLFQSFDFEVPDEGYSNLSTLSVPDEGYSRNVLYALNKISMLLLHTEVKHMFSLYASGISEFLNWKHCVLTSTTHHTIYINGLHVYVDLTVCWTIFFGLNSCVR